MAMTNGAVRARLVCICGPLAIAACETAAPVGTDAPPTASGGAFQAATGGTSSGGAALGTGGVGSTTAGVGGAPPGAGGASSGGTTATLGQLAVSGLEIELNPLMPLGAYVRWTTDQPANSEVQFGIGSATHRIVQDEQTTTHEVYVVGMRAETLYGITAISTNASATGSAAGEVTTGSLPSNLPAQADVITAATASYQSGYTLTNFWDSGQAPTLAVILDAEGYPVWYFENGPETDQFGATSTQWSQEGTVVVGNAGSAPAREVDLEGNVLWEGPTGGSAPLSHETVKLPGGTYFVVRESSSTARVEEVDVDNNVLWTFDLYADTSITNNGANDWCHVNTAYTDPTEAFLYFNCRYQGFFKIDRGTKGILWHLGAAMDDDQSGDVAYLPDNSVRYNDAHDPEVHDDGTVLIYDNQGWANRSEGQQNGSFHSQVVEYQLDEGSKQATLTWQFPGSFSTDPWYTEGWMTPIWGDADRLENGNVLVTAGVTGTGGGGMTPPGTKTRLFEVTREGQIAWAIEWPETKGSYRAERIALPAVPLP